MNYSDMEQAQEHANMQMCFAAFTKAHPKEKTDAAEVCDDGSWSCPECPWKKTATLHKENNHD